MDNKVSINIMGERTDYDWNQNVVLKVTIQYPQIDNKNQIEPITMINQSYQSQAEQFWDYIRSTLLPQAIDFQEQQTDRDPLPAYEVMLVSNLTYQDLCTISLYFDEYQYSGGAHGNTVRNSDTWNLNTGQHYELKDFFAPGVDYRSYVIDQINQQISTQIEAGENVYFENYQQLVEENFDENSFYLRGGDSPDGLVIYFQQYDIAPYVSGIREFFLPF